MPSSSTQHPVTAPQRSLQLLILSLLWVAIYGAALATPPLLDDADATHAQAAQAMLHTGDWVTLHVNGIRYLEKPPLPYWLTASSLRVFGQNSFAVHLPLALTVLALAWLGWLWGTRFFGERTGFYAALFTLASTGVFLFTRIFIPDALLSLFLALVLYAVLRALEPAANTRVWALTAWLALAAAVLTKGLVAVIFTLTTVVLYLWITRQRSKWHQLHPFTGLALFLLAAAPWHILAGLRNTHGANGHGFLWFYFVNEHVLRFLGRRIPRDYNKIPNTFYWPLHLVWLFPWSLFAPLVFAVGWRNRSPLRTLGTRAASSSQLRSVLMLCLFSTLVLCFFSLSTNQEYYTFPVYLPLLILIAAALSTAESQFNSGTHTRTILVACQGALATVGLMAASALAAGLWSSRDLPPSSDIGSLLAHRAVGQYTLSMSHFFDLTGPSFSALRLPAALACVALALGPLLALVLRLRHKHLASNLAVATSAAVLFVAAHLALERFAPMLSSAEFARAIQQVEHADPSSAGTQVCIYGDQAFGSSIPFYLGQRVTLVDGRTTSMYFGSTFPDAPPVFMTHQQLSAAWGKGLRKLLFVPPERRDEVNALLGPGQILLLERSGKILITDRPLTPSLAILSPHVTDWKYPLDRP